jgi:hypothetical protein
LRISIINKNIRYYWDYRMVGINRQFNDTKPEMDLGLDYWGNFDDRYGIVDIEKEKQRLSEWKQRLQNQSDKFLIDNWLVGKLLNKYEYFGTFNFEPYWLMDKSFEDLQDTIKHFKSILRRKLFGRKLNTKSVYLIMNTGGTKYRFETRDNFKMNFYPVIETVKWIKEYKKYVPVRKHVHILFGELPDNVRLKKDFETVVIDCWMSMKESGERDEQQVKEIYGGKDIRNCSENYITKLRHSSVDWFDSKNFTEIKNQHLLDEDITDWIERNSKEIFESTVVKN